MSGSLRVGRDEIVFGVGHVDVVALEAGEDALNHPQFLVRRPVLNDDLQ